MSESLSDLYFRLGLDISDFKSGFVDAQQTLSQNLRNLDQQNNLIQLRAQVDLSGLDEAESSTEGLRIQQEALNRQLAIQKDRISMTMAAYQEMVQAQGENSNAAYNLALRLEQERLAMAKLEQQYQALSNQEKIALGVNWEMLGAIEPLMKVTDVAAGSRTTLSVLGRAIPIPHVKMATAALVALSAVISGTVDATEELAENNATQTFAGNVQSSAADIGSSFSTIRNDAIMTSNVINENFQTGNNITTFSDFARDFFRVAYLLADESDNFSDAISKVNAQSQFMRTELGEYAVVIAGLIQTWQALAKSAISFVEPTIDGFKEVQQHADELNISLSKTIDLQSLISLAGADYNDVRDYVRGVQDAVIKGDAEDPEVLTLEKYGIAIQNANGSLLSFDETLERLYQGYLKAKQAGEEEAYVIMTNGQAVQDILPFFERLAKAKEDYAKITWSTSDVDALQKTANSLKLMEIQRNEFESSLQTLGLPLADYFAQADFKFYKKLTGLVEENRDTVLEWEFVVVEALKRVDNAVSGIIDSITGKSKNAETTLERLAKQFATAFTGKKIYSIVDAPDYGKNILDFMDEAGKDADRMTALLKEKYQKQAKGIADFSDYYKNVYQSSFFKFSDEANKDADRLTSLFPEKYQSKINGIDFTPKGTSIFEDAQKDLEKYIEDNEKAREETEKTAEEIQAGLSYSYNRIAKYKEELANLEIDLKFGDDDYAKSLAKLDVWYETAMRDAKYYAEEQSKINELYNAKAELIEKNRLEKIAEIRRQYAQSDQTELAKQLADIESEAESWIKLGMNSDEALEIAEKRKIQTIKQLEEDFAASTNTIHKNELESRLAQIEKEKQAWIQKGIDEVEATKAAETQKAQARKQLEDSFSEKVNSLNQTDIARRFSEIEREQKSWVEKGIDDVRAMKLAEAQEVEAIKQLNEEWAEHTDSIFQTALENRLAQIEKEKQAWIQKGVDEVRATKAAEQEKVNARRDSAMNIIKSQLKEYEIFQRGGYSALQQYKLDDLIKTTHVDPRLLRDMTPQMVSEFQEALRIAERSLLPNFMTEQDQSDRLDILKQEQDIRRAELEKIVSGMTVNGETPNIDVSQFLSGSISVFTTNIDDVTSKLNELPQPIADVTQNFSELSGIIHELLTKVNVREVNASNGNAQSSNNPVTVNVTVNIEEAHAWDSEHIQELADKVADEIEPEIVRAVGGDSNSY